MTLRLWELVGIVAATAFAAALLAYGLLPALLAAGAVLVAGAITKVLP